MSVCNNTQSVQIVACVSLFQDVAITDVILHLLVILSSHPNLQDSSHLLLLLHYCRISCVKTSSVLLNLARGMTSVLSQKIVSETHTLDVKSSPAYP